MIALKDYQLRVLDAVSDFFRRCAQGATPAEAFQAVQQAHGMPPQPYLPAQTAGLPPGLPYVCLRVPTGGGKTLLACHTAGLALHELLHRERAVVLWLVPSNTILDQTADALRDPRHPYRRALELSCGGGVEVVTIEEALQLSHGTVAGQTVVIVATIQAFRVEDTTGRKVYAPGNFQEHLALVPAARRADLLLGPDRQPIPSLVNLLRLERPIVIVDEAHNARTDLSFATLGAVQPACIVEFTATPAREKHPSNVLYRVSAAELHAAAMIKMPLRVVTMPPAHRDQLLAGALSVRADLEKLALGEAQQSGRYLRPILLLQAERVDDCEALRDRLVNDFKVAREAIKIAVGKLDELKDIKDLTAPACPVRVILTVQKLREGWDCPFAYVLCSLQATRSATAIEQIVGRILRLPHAERKQHPDLNCGYVFSASTSLPEVLNELREALESNGFTSAEAERIVLPVQETLPLGAQPKTVHLAPEELDTALAPLHQAALGDKVQVDLAQGTITVLVPLDEDETVQLTCLATTPAAKEKLVQAALAVREAEVAFGGTGQPRQPTFYEQGLDFRVPLLCVVEHDQYFEFERTFLLEHPWRLGTKDATLAPSYNPLARPASHAGMVGVSAKGDVQTMIVSETEDADFVAKLHQQTLALGLTDEWDLPRLVAWLDAKISHQDIPVGESAEFLRRAIRGLMATHGITDVSVLALDRYRLRDAIEARIQQHRVSENQAAFQQFLLPDSALVVNDQYAINFKTMLYEPSQVYGGAFQFKKHYFGPKPGELTELRADGKLTEEFQCAQYLDGLPQVRCWVRNLARKASSFRLQTSTDWFYPDFVCQLTDGRILVVEYKGQHLSAGPDAEEKRAIGATWAARSQRKCLFVMPTSGKLESITSGMASA